jgi:transcriptional regulator with XRE-family HTH domain
MSRDTSDANFHSRSATLAESIRTARKSAGLNQAEFGRRLGVSQSAISNWESGEDKPSPLVVRKLAEMTQGADFIVEYLDASGIPHTMVGESKHISSLIKDIDIKEIIQLRDPNAAGTLRALDVSEAETILRLPRSWFPAQSPMIYAIKIEDDSMAPVIASGSLVFVDTSQRDPEILVNKLIVVRTQSGVAVRSLRKDHRFFLVPHHGARTSILSVESGSSQTIIGKVVMWVTHPQERAFVDLILRYRAELEEMMNTLLQNKRSPTKRTLRKIVSELVKTKRVDPTLGRLIVMIIEIADRAAHGMEITREDFEQVCHFMPIIRSSLRERRPSRESELDLAPRRTHMIEPE